MNKTTFGILTCSGIMVDSEAALHIRPHAWESARVVELGRIISCLVRSRSLVLFLFPASGVM